MTGISTLMLLVPLWPAILAVVALVFVAGVTTARKKMMFFEIL